MAEQENQIITNASEGYGYSYSSLADLARAGVKIPVMKTERVEGEEYVFAKVGDEWIQGAKVIELEMKGMNPAQAYGSALTYARRYTVQLVAAIACDDDSKLEAHSAEDRKNFSNSTKKSYNISFDSIQERLDMIDDLESLKDYYAELKAKKLSDKQMATINKMVNKAKERING